MYILLFSETHSTLMTLQLLYIRKFPPKISKAMKFFFFTIKQFLKEPVDMLQTNQYSCICNSLCTCNKRIIINQAMNRFVFFSRHIQHFLCLDEAEKSRAWSSLLTERILKILKKHEKKTTTTKKKKEIGKKPNSDSRICSNHFVD